MAQNLNFNGLESESHLQNFRLKGHSQENVCEIIALNYSLDQNKGPPTHFDFFKIAFRNVTNVAKFEV
jgi:hypothetical protein